MQVLLMAALQDAGLENYMQVIMGVGQQGQGSPATPPAPAVPVGGVGTEIAPQEELGAARSQEMGLGPKAQMFPEEEPLGEIMPTA